MKPAFFSRLAVEGMKKNRRIYLPYILSCIGMVAMFYIMMELSMSPAVKGMAHGGDIAFILSLGKFVIAVFALLFLFYTNSFLTKKRYKEYGLYSILGMNRKNISKIVFWESAIVAAMGLLGGFAAGIILSKLAEMGLLYMAKEPVGFEFNINPTAVLYTAEIFLLIFVLLMIKSIIKVSRCKPVDLMQSEHEGEKPLKANWVFAVLGLLILAAAYYLAVTIDNPLQALFTFFVAVIMVIIGTYLLFIAGSVALCKLLQKKKNYYYRKNHFVAVSSMAYRMKRNGAGLASICILVTMVLVMISSTGSLYFGSDDAMRTRYPYDTEIAVYLHKVENLSDERVAEIQKAYDDVFAENNFRPEGMVSYRFANINGQCDGSHITADTDFDSFTVDYSKVVACYFVNQDDYNRLMGTDLSVKPGEAYIFGIRRDYRYDEISIEDFDLQIAGKLDDFPELSETSSILFPSLMMVISDFDQIKPLEKMEYKGEKLLSVQYYCGYNCSGDEQTAIDIYHKQCDALAKTCANTGNGYGYHSGCLFSERDDFYSTFGGLFFLGIILSIVFTFAAAVIIYYKQVSEGYEDQKRFEIMQNVGMTKEDIKQTINSQVLTVFFAPLAAAGVHLCFAFPFIWKILTLFNLRNLKFVILITAIAYVAFGLFYALIYRITSKNYYSIVSRN